MNFKLLLYQQKYCNQNTDTFEKLDDYFCDYFQIHEGCFPFLNDIQISAEKSHK
jgi:hypothetical protein